MIAARPNMKYAMLGLVVVSATGGCTNPVNCDSACGDHLELDVVLNVAPATLIGATVTMCQNGGCASGVLAADGVMLGEVNATNIRATLTGNFTALAVVTTDGGVAAGTEGSPATFVDGDVWTLTVTGTTGMVLFDAGSAVHYDAIQTCTNTCQEASVTLSGSPLPTEIGSP
jgi:hypothetical protein